MQHKQEICVVASDFNYPGGAEELTLRLCKVLKNLGYKVQLIVTSKVDWQYIQKVFNLNNNIIDKEIVINLLNIKQSIYSRLYYWILRDLIALNIFKRKCRFLIVTKPSYPIVNANIVYIHFPDFIYEGFLINNAKKYNTNLFYKIYSLPYKFISDIFKNLYNLINNKPLLIVNSKFSQSVLHRYLGYSKSVVVYPPVKVKRYIKLAHIFKDRDDIVVTISRFDPLKNLEIIPDIMTRVRKAKFILIGSVGKHNDYYYIRQIKRKAKRLGVEDRLIILTNVPEDIKLKILSKAKVYLHTMKYEHFGISIVESMAAGLIPVVHRSGGPWTDILNCRNGVYGYAYRDLEEVSQYILKIIENKNLSVEMLNRVIERAKVFSVDTFEKRIQSILETMLKL